MDTNFQPVISKNARGHYGQHPLDHADRVTTAKRIFEECGAEHIHATTEAHVSH